MPDTLYSDSFASGDMSTRVPEIGVAYSDGGSSQSLSNLVLSSGRLPLGTNNSHTYIFTQPLVMSGRTGAVVSTVFGVDATSGFNSATSIVELRKVAGTGQFYLMSALLFSGTVNFSGSIRNAAGSTIYNNSVDIASYITVGGAGVQLSMVITPSGVSWRVGSTEVLNSGGIVCDRPLADVDLLYFYATNNNSNTRAFLDSAQLTADEIVLIKPTTDALMFGSAF